MSFCDIFAQAKVLRGGVLVGLATLIALTPLSATALSDAYREKFEMNDIVFYNPESCPDGASGGSGGVNNCTAVTGDQITWIGDSYSVGARSVIESKLPGISFGGSVNDDNSYIQGCKNVKTDTTCNANPSSNPSGLKVLERIVSAGELKPYLVFALGTNEGWDSSSVNSFKDIMKNASGTKVVFVNSKTPASDYTSSNQTLKDLADSSSDYSLADWVSVYDASYFPIANGSQDIHPSINGGYDKWVEVIYNALPRCTGGIAGDGDFSKVLTAKNAEKSYFNHSGNIDAPAWSDTDQSTMKKLLENYGDLAYQLGLATGAPWIAIITQLRYEDAYSECGKNNFWGNGCPPGTGIGGASIQGENLGEGFMQYGQTLLNTSLDGSTQWYAPALAESDPKEYLRKLGPLWVQGDANGAGYAHIAAMENSIDALTNYINSSEGQEIVKTFGNYYYDGGVNAGNSSGGSSLNSTGTVATSANGSATNYKGDEILTSDQLAKVAQNQAVYEEAVQGTGLPWQVIAAIHYREFGLSLDYPSNGQGIFQFYWEVVVQHTMAFPTSGTATQEEFLEQAKHVAETFTESINSAGYSPSSEEGIKYGFFAYNGTAGVYKSQALNLGFSQEEAEVGEGSPYVMNRYDEKRDPTVDPTKTNNTWGEIKSDGGSISYPAGENFGAFVIYTALAGNSWTSTGGTSSSSTVCPGSSNSSSTQSGNGGDAITQTAFNLAWPEAGHENQVKPEFRDAAKALGRGTRSYCGGDSELDFAQDCGVFVSVVVQTTGIDPEYPDSGTSYLQSHMEKSDKWKEIENLGNESNLEPGDIFVVNAGGGSGGSGHIFIYVGDGKIASASLCSYTGMIKNVYFSDNRGSYKIFRSTVKTETSGGTTGSFDEGLRAIETSSGVKVGAAVTEPGNTDSSKVQVGGSWSGGRAWSTIKVPLAIAATQKNASTGSVTDPYGGTCSHSLSSAIQAAITQSDNCGAWWLWQALGGDGSSAASAVTSVIKSGGDSSTTVNGTGDGASLTSGKTTWSLVGQAIFAANLASVSNSSNTMTQMRTHNAGDGSHGLNTFTAMSKGGWGNASGTSATRQFGIIKLSNGKCSAVAIGTDSGSNFSILDQIAQVLKDHQDELPSGACPAGL